jgi:hypothetical protein
MTLEEQARQERLEYFREWRGKNRDKVRRSNQRYWENRAKRRQAQEVNPDGGATSQNQTAHVNGGGGC